MNAVCRYNVLSYNSCWVLGRARRRRGPAWRAAGARAAAWRGAGGGAGAAPARTRPPPERTRRPRPHRTRPPRRSRPAAPPSLYTTTPHNEQYISL